MEGRQAALSFIIHHHHFNFKFEKLYKSWAFAITGVCKGGSESGDSLQLHPPISIARQCMCSTKESGHITDRKWNGKKNKGGPEKARIKKRKASAADPGKCEKLEKFFKRITSLDQRCSLQIIQVYDYKQTFVIFNIPYM